MKVGRDWDATRIDRSTHQKGVNALVEEARVRGDLQAVARTGRCDVLQLADRVLLLAWGRPQAAGSWLPYSSTGRPVYQTADCCSPQMNPLLSYE
jgi:hypothetical protein